MFGGDFAFCMVLFVVVFAGLGIAFYRDYCLGRLTWSPPRRKSLLNDEEYQALVDGAKDLSRKDILNILDCLLMDFECRVALKEESPVDREFQAVYAAKQLINYKARNEDTERQISLIEQNKIILDFLTSYVDMLQNVKTDSSYKRFLSRKVEKSIKNADTSNINNVIRNVLEYRTYESAGGGER